MGIRDALAVAAVGGMAWALKRYADIREQEAEGREGVQYLAPAPMRKDPNIAAMIGGMLSLVSAVSKTEGTRAQTVLSQVVSQPKITTPTVGTSRRGLAPLLRLIGSVEAPKGYDQVYGGIRFADRPENRVGKRLTQMTVGEVLAWQDSIDRKYPSEASGRYQIMEDTLRSLVAQGHARASERFDSDCQDRLAVALMERRGLSLYRAGKISETEFAQRLSMEWASLPAMTRDKLGRVANGQSYYAGDGLNKSHLSKKQVLDAVRAI